MKKQVDQSGRLEDSRATVWAIANGDSQSLSMPAAVKRKIFAVLKRQGFTGAQALIRVYCLAMFIMLKDMITAHGIVIELDREYPGYDAEIKSMLLRRFWNAGLKVSEEVITFGNIGKQSVAHDVAWKVYVGRKEPDQKLIWPYVKKLL